MMSKAVVVGGSNGIGLSVALNLINNGYFVYIVDRVKPDNTYLNDDTKYEYIECDLTDFDEDKVNRVIEDMDVNTLFISAGFGRVAKFEDIPYCEIERQMKVNTLSAIHIIKLFYDRMLNDKNFMTGVMVSIAGIISSPLFSTYSASKAALTKFIEALNIELEKSGTQNRILDVSPGSLKGTRFNGKDNDLSLLDDVTSNIINKMQNHMTNYIPEYDEIYRGVIERYNNDPHKFGIESYDYKVNNGRLTGKKKCVIGYLSGTFDLFHVGHLNLLRRAKQCCDYLIVGVHPSAAHKNKETFIPLDERKAIVGACKYVDKVIDSKPEDSDVWDEYKYDKLFVGSDYKGTERFNRYEEYFKDKGVEIIYFPYTNSTSSTQMRELINNKIKEKDE